MNSVIQMRLIVALLVVMHPLLVDRREVSAAERPNVLLILVDDLKPSLGSYGDSVAKTPNIDALAARGMRFDLAYCNQAVCAPSRFTLMLGSHSTSTGLYGLGSQLRQVVPDAVTMPQYFARHGGYRTESLGKVFHIGHGNHGDPESFSVPHFHDKVIEYLDPASTHGGKLTREEAYFTNQKLGQIGSLSRGAAFESPDVADADYADGRVAAETIQRLRAAKERRTKGGRPSFIVAGFARPHLPFSAPKRYWDLYDPASLPMPEFEELPADAPSVAGKRGGEIRNYFPVPDHRDPASISEELKRKLIHGYYASTSFVDAQVGKVIDELDRTGLADNTIVVLWGDHGFHLGDLGIWTKHTNYEQANRIPLLVAAPGITRPGTSTRQLAESVDIFPTLAELAGLPAPKGPQPIDGVSLVSVLKNPAARVRDHAFHAYPKRKLGRAVRTQRYRLVEWRAFGDSAEAGEYELYDYETDPHETRNLAADKPDVVAALKQTLATYPEPVARNRRLVDNKGLKARGTQSAPPAAPVVDRWRYTLRRPAEGWRRADFDDAGWKESFGGFGIRSTPGSRVGTTWATNSIWLRKSFELKTIPAKPALLVHHDEDAEVYINGKPVAVLKKFTTKYIVVPLGKEKHAALRVGNNVMAVHCRQTVGGQFIDVHLIDADSVPELPKPRKSTRPIQSELITKWGAAVTPENAWTEYPRPALRRKNWTNLNGHWNYTVTPKDAKTRKKWDGNILVPFAIEAPLSGVGKNFTPNDALWYSRSVTIEKKNADRRYKLNFEAVDYESTVWVNGRKVGSHKGGNLPFSFDVTDALKEGENEILLSVTDATDSAYQLHGKQRLTPKGIWYTPVSGIWQTVWMEEVPTTHVTRLKITPKIDGSVRIVTAFSGPAKSTSVKVTASRNGRVISTARGTVTDILLKIPDPQLWSPDSPVLYDLKVEFGDDVVESYVGIRETGRVRDDEGHLRFTLNGKPIFHWGTLDQGWWPDGLLTPPSDEAMVFDIEFLKAAGFNTIRKHIKVEPRRYYYHCDRLGMMVWQDQVSARRLDDPEWIRRLQPSPPEAAWPAEAHTQYMAELKGMIDSLYSHPSIVQWVPFNERWGQHQTMDVGRWTVDYDPTRDVNIASGGNFFPVGHIADEHEYPHPEFPFDQGEGGRFHNFVKVVGEFGGHGFPVEGHLWSKTARNWGYGGLPKNKNEWLERYRVSIRKLADLKKKGVAAGIYTQTTDVEGEINGLMTYDRKVIKIPAKDLAELHAVLFEDARPQAAVETNP